MRFPEFSVEWKETTIGECCSELEYGMNAPSKYFDGVNKYIRITDIDEQTSEYKQDSVVSPDAPLEDKYIVKDRDILFARTGASTGKTYIYNPLDGKMYYAGFLIRANVKMEDNPEFVFYQTQTHRYKKWVSIMSMRSGQPGINSQEYASYKFWKPCKDEQDKISALISLLDTRIQTQKKIIEDLKKLKDAITHSHYRNELLHSPMVYIGQYITQVSKRNKDAKIDRVLSVSNKYGFINQDEQFEDREVASADTSNYKVVHKGDFAYNPARINVGSVARLQEFENGIVSPMYVCFTAKKGLLPAYFELYLCTSIFKHEMNKRLEGSVRLCLTYESLSNIKIALPEINVQKDFVSKVSAILTKISAEERLLYLYDNCKQFLLSQMFI